MKPRNNLQTPSRQARWKCRKLYPPLNENFFRILLPVLFLWLLVAGCKTASPNGMIGYNYTVQAGDTIDAIAGEYRKQGVDVTVDQILAANPNLKATTNIQAGVQLFIPDNKQANLEDLEAKASHGVGAWIGGGLGGLCVGFEEFTVPAGEGIGGFVGGLIGGFGGSSLGAGAVDRIYQSKDEAQKAEIQNFIYQYYGVNR